MKNLIKVLVLSVLFPIFSQTCYSQMFPGDYPYNLRYYSTEIQIRYNHPGIILPAAEFYTRKRDKGLRFLEDTLPKLVGGDYEYAKVFDSVFSFSKYQSETGRKHFAEMANLPDGHYVQDSDKIRHIYIVPHRDDEFNFFVVVRYYNGRLNSVVVIGQYTRSKDYASAWNGKEGIILIGKNNTINPESDLVLCLENLLEHRRRKYWPLYQAPVLAASPTGIGDAAGKVNGVSGPIWKQGKNIRLDTGIHKDTIIALTVEQHHPFPVTASSTKAKPIAFTPTLPKVVVEPVFDSAKYFDSIAEQKKIDAINNELAELQVELNKLREEKRRVNMQNPPAALIASGPRVLPVHASKQKKLIPIPITVPLPQVVVDSVPQAIVAKPAEPEKVSPVEPQKVNRDSIVNLKKKIAASKKQHDSLLEIAANQRFQDSLDQEYVKDSVKNAVAEIYQRKLDSVMRVKDSLALVTAAPTVPYPTRSVVRQPQMSGPEVRKVQNYPPPNVPIYGPDGRQIKMIIRRRVIRK